MISYKEEIENIKNLNLYRAVKEYTPHRADKVLLEGKECLLLASNNYLGLTHNEEVKAAAIEAIVKYGTGSGGARLTTGCYPLLSQLEERISQFKHQENGRIFNAGYMANVGVLSSLGRAGDVIFSDELNHASIIDGIRLSRAKVAVYRHVDLNHLEELLKTTPCSGQRIIVTDGVFSMDGDIAPLPELATLAKRYKALLVVDEAHSTGVLGPKGEGTKSHFNMTTGVDLEVGTLSKALAAEGGFVTASEEFIEYFTNRARSFIFSTTLSPAPIGAALKALKILQTDASLVDKLRSNTKAFKDVLRENNIEFLDSPTPIIPILIKNPKICAQVAEEILEAGIIVSAIRPPTVATSRLRITVTAAHNEEDLREAARIIAEKISKK